MRWERQDERSAWAYSGRRLVGMVGLVRSGERAGQHYWTVEGVTGSEHQPATRGWCSTEPGAKRAFRRAWRIWLAERGLAELPEANAS